MESVIKINISNKESYINKFNEERISLELEEYILNEMKMIKLKDKVVIEIATDFVISDSEKEKLAFMIKNTYKDEYVEMQTYNKGLIIKDSILLLLGTFLIIIYYFFEHVKFVNEYLIIVGWFFIWKSLESFLFLDMENRMKLLKKRQLLYSKIKFI